jgi:hypothetical protein
MYSSGMSEKLETLLCSSGTKCHERAVVMRENIGPYPQYRYRDIQPTLKICHDCGLS